MFQNSGLFRDISCPYFKFGLCERPYCHFKHSKHDETKAKATVSLVTGTTSETLSKSDDDKYSVPTSSLERTLKDIEENIKSEKSKLKSKNNIDSGSCVLNKPSIKTKPTGTPEYNPTPITVLKNKNNKSKPGQSKYDLALLAEPSSIEEYDPASNFEASFKGTVSNVPEYAVALQGTKRPVDDDEVPDSSVAKIPKFVSVEYTPAVDEPVFSDDEPAGDKEDWFSEEEGVKDSSSDLGENEQDLQNNVVDSASDIAAVSEIPKPKEENTSKEALPFEFTPEGFIKTPILEKPSAKTKSKDKEKVCEKQKPNDKECEKQKVEKRKELKKEEEPLKETDKKVDTKNIFSLFMAAAESVLSKSSAEDKLELKSAIDKINTERRNSTESKIESDNAVSSSTSSSQSTSKDKSAKSHSKESSRSSNRSDRIRSTNDLERSGSKERHDKKVNKTKETSKDSSAKSIKDKPKHDESERHRHKKQITNSKSVSDKSSHKNHKSRSPDRSSEKLGKSSSSIHHKSKRTTDSSSHLNHQTKPSDKFSHSSGKRVETEKHNVSHDRKFRDSHSNNSSSKHVKHSVEKGKEIDKNVTSEGSRPSAKNKTSVTPKRRKSSEKVKTLVKTRKIVDLNVDLFGDDSDSETKGNKESTKDYKKEPELDSDINHYDDSDLDIDNLELNTTSQDVENEFSDLEKYFSDEDPFDECLRIFNEEGPSTSGPEKKKSKKKEAESVPESSSGKKRIGMKQNDQDDKKFTIEDKPVPKPSPAQVMMNRYKMMQQRALEAQEEEKEKLKKKVRKISAQNAMNAPPSSSKTIGDASTSFSSYLANRKKPPPKKTTAITVAKGQKRKAHTPTVPVEKLKRPVVEVSTSAKVPTNIRQRYLNLMIDECLKLYKSEKEAFDRATKEEELVYSSISNKNIYLNKAVNTIKRLRTEIENKASSSKSKSKTPVKMSHDAMLDGAHASKASYTLHRSGGAVKMREEDFTGAELYKRLEPYILTEDQLKTNNFPRPDSSSGGKAVYYGEDRYAQKARVKGYEKVCVRCGKIFEVYPNGKYPKKEECVYHWGKAYKKRIAGALETRYTCCSGDLGSEGCQVCKAHVHETNKKENLSGFMQTIPCSPPPGGDSGVYALDCEMVYTTLGVELARVTVVGSDQEPIYESLVKPDRPVVDYNTRFSGITEEDLEDVSTSIRDVQAVLLSLFTTKTILIGHSLESDLSALKLIHSTVVDTSIVFPHRLGLPYKRALKNLMAEYLKKIIQDDVAGHDSHEDAISCLQLMQLKLKEDARKEGRR